jgi:DNA-binding response OmpR family regulator
VLFTRGEVSYIEYVKMGKKALLFNNSLAHPLVAGLLTRTGFEIDLAPDSEMGLRRLEMQAYDITVIIESHGSEIWQLCQKIKNLTTIPLIVISTNASPDACARAIDAGADYFMRKPFGPLEFLARVNSLLQRSLPRQAIPVGS